MLLWYTQQSWMVELPSPLDDSVKIQMLALKLPRWCLPYWSCFALISACYPPLLPIKLEMFPLYHRIVEVCDLFYFFAGGGETLKTLHRVDSSW